MNGIEKVVKAFCIITSTCLIIAMLLLASFIYTGELSLSHIIFVIILGLCLGFNIGLITLLTYNIIEIRRKEEED